MTNVEIQNNISHVEIILAVKFKNDFAYSSCHSKRIMREESEMSKNLFFIIVQTERVLLLVKTNYWPTSENVNQHRYLST